MIRTRRRAPPLSLPNEYLLGQPHVVSGHPVQSESLAGCMVHLPPPPFSVLPPKLRRNVWASRPPCARTARSRTHHRPEAARRCSRCRCRQYRRWREEGVSSEDQPQTGFEEADLAAEVCIRNSGQREEGLKGGVKHQIDPPDDEIVGRQLASFSAEGAEPLVHGTALL